MSRTPGRTSTPLFTRGRWLRLGAEFAVVFASVVLALIADDWRSERNQRTEEARVLQLIVRDLDEDAGNLRFYRSRLEAQVEGARDFFRHLETGAPDDSLMVALGAALDVWNYRPTFPAYRGLMQSGRLHLIRDDLLRDTIIAHYDETIVYLDDLRAYVAARHDRAFELLQRHFGPRTDVSSSWEFELVSSRRDLAADTEALSALAHAARSREWLAFRIEQIFLPAHEGVARAVRTHLR